MAKQRCPDCAEQISAAAVVCRFCGYRLTEADIDQAGHASTIGTVVKVAVGLVVILAISQCVAGNDSPPISSPKPSLADQLPGAEIAPPIPTLALQLDRFTWEAESDGNCHAAAKVTNTGAGPLKFARLTMQFLRKGALVGTEESYLDVTDLAPGASSTWSAVYTCPGGATTAEVTATSRGKAVDVVGPPVKRRR